MTTTTPFAMSSEDKYDTLEKIGHGSFGVIRKVRRKTDGFIMCRKEISYLRMSQKEREQLHAEFQILSHLRHPNIVAYYHREHLKASQDLHLYMEYCGNGDLGRVIKDLQHKGQRAEENFVWSIFSQLVMALYRCHYGVDPPETGDNALGLTLGGANAPPKTPAGAMTILHRDLKPENVFLGEGNSVKLGDFGLSKMIKSHDFASTYVGTPFYMSPEICAAEKYTLKSDIWSLGCIIYELCAREPPFNAKTHYQLVQKIKEGRVAALPELYSADLNQVIRDCLRVNPDKRPDTVQLLNIPNVKWVRVNKEKAELRDLLRRMEKENNDLRTDSNRERGEIRREIREEVRKEVHGEIDASVRREWEVKARLEIDRHINMEMQRQQKRFEEKIQALSEAESQRARSIVLVEPDETSASGDRASASSRPDHPPPPPPSSNGFPRRSCSNDEGQGPFHADLTESLAVSPKEEFKELRRTSRTPMGRAQTMFASHAATPMDIEMLSPSPVAIANLSLSPRRNYATKAPMSHSGNIFAANANRPINVDSRFDMREPLSIESDEEDTVPSPSRNVRSSKNPFTSKCRPVLTSHKTAPINGLRRQASATGLVSKTAISAPVEPASRSPTRQISKIPSITSMQSDLIPGGLARKQSAKRDNHNGGEALNKMAAKNNIKGRTLVELQQARAGGRPPSAPSSALENTSPKRVAFKDRIAEEQKVRLDSGPSSSSGSGSGSSIGGNNEPVAVWDPERDEMPSPFLVKQKRIDKV